MEIDWVSRAQNRPVYDIGQIDRVGLRSLAAAVRSGELIRTRAPWAAGYGPIKTVYAASQSAFDADFAATCFQFELYRVQDAAVRSKK